MSVFHGKLTAAEQPKCGWQTKGQRGKNGCICWEHMYSKMCLWLRGQEMHLGGNWNVGRLKGGDQYGFFLFFIFLFFWWELQNDFHPFSYVCEDAQSSLAHLTDEKQKRTRGVWHTFSFQRKDLARPSTRRLEPGDPCFHECGSLKEESGSDRGWGREVYGRGGGVDEERLLLDLITVKHWTLIGDIKTFYESSCSNLQHYNSVPVQSKSAAAL